MMIWKEKLILSERTSDWKWCGSSAEEAEEAALNAKDRIMSTMTSMRDEDAAQDEHQKQTAKAINIGTIDESLR